MTIESHFYDTKPGEGINEVEWAQATQSRQSTYGVAADGELLCTAHPSTPYAVNISPAPSGFWGQGVWDTSDAIETVVCPAPGNGIRRFDLIAAHRDWTPTGGGPTRFLPILGSASRALPSGRANTPGEVDDQSLWLVEWLGGQTQPQSLTDLRVIGGRTAKHKLALDGLPHHHPPIQIGNWEYRYSPLVNGNWDWLPHHVGDSGWINIASAANGFIPITTNGWSGMRFRVVNGWAMINAAVRRSTPWGDDAVITTLSADLAPAIKIQGVGCQITGAGSVSLVTIPAGSNFASFSAMWPLEKP